MVTIVDRGNRLAGSLARAAGSLIAVGMLAAAVYGIATAQHRDGSGPLTLESLETGLPSTYGAEPIRAEVIEEQTGFGLEGVHILARWEVRHVVGGVLPSLAVQEAITGPKGEFVIPGFAPRPRPAGGVLFAHSPQLVLFKPGFIVLELRNEPRSTFVKRFPNYKSMSAKEITSVMRSDGAPKQAVQTSFWNNMTIGLELFSGSEHEWLVQLQTVADTIRDEEAPFAQNMLAALRAERSHFNIRKLSVSDRRHFQALFARLDRLLENRSSR